MREFIDIIKGDKRSKILFVITIGVLFICTLSYSLSMFSNSKEGNVANIKVNGLSFNMTTNSGESDDRILKLKANTLESFNVVLTNLNSMDVKYELIYEVCSDSTCSSTIDKLPDDIVFGISNDSIGKITDTIIVNNKKDIYLLSNNNTNQDYYIKLNLNAGYSWNELALINQIDKYSKDIDFIAYVDGIEQDKFPDSCNYSYTYKTYNNGIETSDSEVTLTCSNGVWDISVKNVPNKVRVWFTFLPLKDYIAKLDKEVNGLEEDTTADKNLRYVGSNPNNYISFNNETWRIIGVFDVINAETNETEQAVKIIRNESIGEYAWDTSDSSVNGGYGINEWSQADLMEELNNEYLGNYRTGHENWYNGSNNQQTGIFDTSQAIKTEYQQYIMKAVWNLGGWDTTINVSAAEMYTYERGTTVYPNASDGVTRTTTWDGLVALMYPSDYGFSSTDSTCRSNFSKCNNVPSKNWVYSGSGEWLLTPGSSGFYNVFCVVPSGNVGNANGLSGSLAVRPSVYLKADVLKKSGDGTSSSPYIISL